MSRAQIGKMVRQFRSRMDSVPDPPLFYRLYGYIRVRPLYLPR